MNDLQFMPHQEEVLNLTDDKNRCAYYLDMGLGKTFVGAEKMYLLNNTVNLIVFSLMVLRARVSVQLRNKEAAAKNSMELDGFEFYFDKMEFFKNGELIELSKTEQKLLKVLCENRGKVVKREYLIDEVWQGDTEFVDAHALTVAVKRLRDKLEDDTQKPKYIKTVYGIGYTWAVNG